MKKGTIAKWSLVIMLLMLDVLVTGALVYSVFQSHVMISGNDPFILNVAMIIVIFDVALWIITILVIYEIRSDSSLDQRLVTLERLLLENGFNNRK
jgi:hypothetical protein